MKSKEELTALKTEVENLNSKLRELTDEELEQVTGGGFVFFVPIYAHHGGIFNEKGGE